MQLLAREFNYSKTVFVRRRPHSTPDTYDIRFYTPFDEEAFCGHGIVGAAHALHLSTGLTAFRFVTFAGVDISVSISTRSQTWANDGDTVSISMYFPLVSLADRARPSSNVEEEIAAAFGIDAAGVLKIGMNELRDILLELNPERDFSVEEMIVDPVKSLAVSLPGTTSQAITRSWALDEDVDLVKRVLASGSEGMQMSSSSLTHRDGMYLSRANPYSKQIKQRHQQMVHLFLTGKRRWKKLR